MENNIELKNGIKIISEKAIQHSKAAEEYIEVSFPFKDNSWNLWIPIMYRRSGLYLNYPGKEKIDEKEYLDARDMLYDYLNKVGESIPRDEESLSVWKKEQLEWWDSEKLNAKVTAEFEKSCKQTSGNYIWEMEVETKIERK